MSDVTVSVSDTFDGGNIEFIHAISKEDDSIDVIVRIKPDIHTELEKMAHMQYFCFRVTIGGLGNKKKKQRVNYIIENAERVSYPTAWPGSTVFYTNNVEDVDSWKRNRDTAYVAGQLSWPHVHESNGSIYFSYFPPYSYARHLSFMSRCASLAHVGTLGQSLEGREMDYIVVGTGSLVAWVIHRQHPGESMAEHYAEGLLTRLLGLDNNGDVDGVVKQLLSLFTFYIVPCMCPDGAVKGHLRTNAAGANLNREWTSTANYEAPSLERSPEVYYTLEKMKETGCDFFLDVHGDEELPFNFLSGAANIPNWGPRLEALHGAFCAAYSRQGEMQQKYGYPATPAETVLKYMNVACNQIGYRFDCLAVTLEMPFKDCKDYPDPDYGWNPKRSRDLGASVLEALLYVAPQLHTTEAPRFSPEDVYVETTNDYQEEYPTEQDGFKMIQKRFFSDVYEINKPK
mmetsp:Transcript_12461/g.18285  ORF Transcript_12461/g.18285 Transcript_12461/m.18285 type:complete len:457 (+) Transcript_12461:150-1520(+)